MRIMYMQKIKGDIRKPTNILSQLFNRISEHEKIKNNSQNNKTCFNRLRTNDGILPKGCMSPQFLKYEFNK